jgi:hypothetical protein
MALVRNTLHILYAAPAPTPLFEVRDKFVPLLSALQTRKVVESRITFQNVIKNLSQ